MLTSDLIHPSDYGHVDRRLIHPSDYSHTLIGEQFTAAMQGMPD